MRVTVRATGALRHLLPGGKEQISIDYEKPLSIREVLSEKLEIDPASIAAVIVNGRHQKRDHIPLDGDEIIIIPPMGGG